MKNSNIKEELHLKGKCTRAQTQHSESLESFKLTFEFRNCCALMEYQRRCMISLSGYSVDKRKLLFWP